MTDLNSTVVRRLGEMQFALCEAEMLLKQKDEEIASLKGALSAACAPDGASTAPEDAMRAAAQEMLASR